MWQQAVVVLWCTAAVALGETITSPKGKVVGGKQNVKKVVKEPGPGSIHYLDTNCWNNAGRHLNGKVWTESNFKLRCTRGRIDVIACVAGPEANYAEIHIGGHLNVGGVRYRCERRGDEYIFDDGAGAERRCDVDGLHMKLGETRVVQRHFKMRCTATGTTVVACVVDEGGYRQDIALGHTKVVGGRRWSCNSYGNGGANLVGEGVATGGCVDKLGRRKRIGDTWVETGSTGVGKFKMQCNHGGGASIRACIVEASAHNHYRETEIPLGQSRVVGTVEWSCTKSPYSNTVELKPRTNGCMVDGRQRNLGEKWVQTGSTGGRFKMQCNHGGGASVVACIVEPSAHHYRETEVPLGQSRVVGTVEWSCTKSYGNTVHLTPKRMGCSANGQTKHVGEQWVQDNFRKECTAKGTSTIGCVLPDGTHLSVGGQRVIGHYMHSCTREWDQIKYTTRPYLPYGGYNGPYQQRKAYGPFRPYTYK